MPGVAADGVSADMAKDQDRRHSDARGYGTPDPQEHQDFLTPLAPTLVVDPQ